jgi:hypothetical protein
MAPIFTETKMNWLAGVVHHVRARWGYLAIAAGYIVWRRRKHHLQQFGSTWSATAGDPPRT